MIKATFTVGPLDANQGAGLTIATAGLARALARSGASQVTVFGRKPGGTIDASLWNGVAVRARGRLGSRIRELDLGLASAISTGGPLVIHSHGLWLAHQWSAWRAAQGANIPRVVTPHGQLEAWAL